MTRSLVLAVSASTALAACSQPSPDTCSQDAECSPDARCVEGICQRRTPSRFVYVTDTGTSSIQSFAIDQATGALTHIETVPAGSGPTGLVVTPDLRFLVAANSDAPAGSWGNVGTVSVFARNVSTGTIAQIPNSPFPANTMALNVAMTPSGRFFYATDQVGHQLSVFAMDAVTGALAQASFSPVAEIEAHSIAMHPSGAFFYVGSEEDEVKGHVIAAAAGDGSYTDTTGSPYQVPGANNSLSITPDGRYLYSVDATSGNIHGFSIASTGELAPLATSPVTILNENLRTSAVKPSGDFLYVGRWSGNSVAAFRIDRATGALTEVNGSPFAAGTNPKAMAFDGQGRFLYVLNFGSHTLSAFRVDHATGALTPIDTYTIGPVVARAGPKAIIAAP